MLKTWLSGGLPASLMPHLKADHWTVSLDKQAIGPVTSAKIGLKAGSDFWAVFAFEVAGEGHTIACERPLQGGDSTITYDAQAVPGHVAFATHLHGFPPEVRLEIDVVLNAGGRYRFDAKVH